MPFSVYNRVNKKIFLQKRSI